MIYSKENIINLPEKGIADKVENPDSFKHLHNGFFL